MLYKVSEKIVIKVFGEDDENMSEHIYGIELFFCSFFSTVIMMILGVLLHSFIETIVFIVSFCALRMFSGGYHSNSFILCNVSTICIYLLTVLVYNFYVEYIIQWYISVPVFLITFLFILCFSPVKNDNNPLSKTQLIQCKIKAIIVLMLETAVFVFMIYVCNFVNVAIMIPTLFFVDVLIVFGLLKNEGGEINVKQSN